MGIKGISPMIGFKNFDIVQSLSIEYMHGALLGVTKNLLSFWLDSAYHQKPFHITPKQRLIVNKRLSAIKLCRFINRSIISLDSYPTFKSSQYRTFLLYLFPVLHGILRKKYFDHFQLFSSSIYILLKEQISKDELLLVDGKLKKFVHNFEVLYEKTSMTMNVHCLLHLVECVNNLGPLWAFSMFSFESFNGTLTKYGKSPNNVINQVVERVILNVASERATDEQKQDIVFNEIQPSVSDQYALKNYGISDTAKFYAAMKRGTVVFSSKRYLLAKKTADFFIETINNEFGIIEFYVANENEFYAMICEYAVEPSMDQVFIATKTSKFILVCLKDILQKLIYMKIKDKEYVVRRPNKFEMN